MNCLRISSNIALLSQRPNLSFSYIRLLNSHNFGTLASSFRANTALNRPFAAVQKRYNSDVGNEIATSGESSFSSVTDSGGFVNNTVEKLSILSEAPFTHAIENVLLGIHGVDMLSWPATIFVAAFLFRLSICFPIKVYQERMIAKLINVQARVRDQFEEKTSSINKKAVFMNPDLRKKLNQQRIIIQNELYKKENCQPQKIPIASLLQLPIWIFISTAIRNLTVGAGDPLAHQQLINESFLWLTNLASPDPYFILPILFAAMAYTNITYSSLSSEKLMNRFFNYRKNFSIFFVGIMAMLIANMPASVGLFWVSSNSLHLLETLLLDSKSVRRIFKVPKTSREPDSVYLYKLNAFFDKLKKLKRIFK